MTEQDVPEIDIYDRQFHKSAAWKEYFESDSIDAELDHPDFENREIMRRKIAQKALNRYIIDLTKLASSDWTHEEYPTDNMEWFQLRMANDIIEDLFAHFHRIYEEE